MSNKPIQRSSTAPSIARAYASLGLPTSSSTASWVDRTSTSASHRPSAVSRDSNSRPTKRRKEEEYDSPHHKKTPISRVSSDSSWVDVSPVVETTASTSTSKQSAAQVARSNSAPQPVGSSVGNQAAPASSRASLVASATWPSLGQGSNQVESSSSTTKSASHLRIHKIRTADLKVTIIAHCPIAQSAMDAVQLPYGIQRELARGVTTDLWNWQAVLAKLHLFKDFPKSAAGAYKVASLMLDKPLGSAVDLDVWEELDREQLAILENQGRGLGLQGDWEGVADWYGGRLQQIVKFKEAKDGSLTLELLPLEKRRSFRFARFAGSRRILILRRPKELTPKMQEALCGKFVLCGRVYVPFHTKDTSTYMVEVDEDYQRRPSVHEGDGSRMSLRLFFRAFNDLDLNGDQQMDGAIGP
ncbi:hypothetical protein BDV98DRAFT_599146 [Pterulicium gracile]|uniref:Uncharacterized protein n=1 Tax=Pterulicium gracile TaxID=1884261 RepID=A0A5C3Q4D5_9AGAR|nr:hypothetical protein BDV98DRAFT_599146 [Pterula gracilis]